MKQTEKFETLKKQATVAGSVVIGTVTASGAFAAPIDSLVITDINVTLSGSANYLLDLDNDGDADFFLAQSEDDISDAAFIKTVGLESNILSSGNFFRPFQEGDSVPGTSKSFFTDFAEIYETLFLDGGAISAGPLAEIGASAYIGLVLELPADDILIDVDQSFVSHFGWLEVERGSLNIIRSGFQTVAGLSAPIPDSVSAVPLPATLPLLLAGAGGLMALRRRKSAA